jgi:hypothetical protein
MTLKRYPISIVPGAARTRAVHFAGTILKFVRMQNIVGALWRSVRFFNFEAPESPGALTKKKSKEKT